MSINHLHPFAAGSGANTLTESAWEALIAAPGGGVPTSGFVDGIASAAQINTVLRQVSVVAAALGQFVVDVAGLNVNDDGSTANFEAGFREALDSLYVPLDALAAYVKASDYPGLLQPNGLQPLVGGALIQFGVTPAINGDAEYPVVFPEPFPNACFGVYPVADYTGLDPSRDFFGMVRNVTRAGAYVARGWPGTNANAAGLVYWFAIGH